MALPERHPEWTASISSLSMLSELSTLSQASPTSFSPTDAISSLPFTSQITTEPYSGIPFTSPFPSATATSQSSSGILGTASTSAPASLTTAVSVTLTLPSTTLVTTTFSIIPNSAQSPSNTTIDPVCAGQGLDAAGTGVIASLVFTAAIGIIIWVSFSQAQIRLS